MCSVSHSVFIFNVNKSTKKTEFLTNFETGKLLYKRINHQRNMFVVKQWFYFVCFTGSHKKLPVNDLSRVEF